jgi:hypothetical protein
MQRGVEIVAGAAAVGAAYYLLVWTRKEWSTSSSHSDAPRLDATITTANQQEPKEEDQGIAVIGDAFVDIVAAQLQQLPQWGGDVTTDAPISQHAGGSALNTTAHLVSIGANTTLHTAFGEDSFGDFLR